MWIKAHERGVTIALRASPNASKDAVVGVVGDRLLVKLTAPPVEGRANKALVKFLARILGVPPSSLTVVRGTASRDKVVFVEGIAEGVVRQMLEEGSK